MSDIQLHMLDCGMPVVIERIDGVKSAAAYWLLPAGSARDPEARVGRSAMWAELLLRGAGDLDARAQADAFDVLGASRSTDVHTFHLKVSSTMLGSRVSDVLARLVEMVRAPRFDEASIEPSRDLCLQAIDALADDPGERCMLAAKAMHAPAPLNRSGMGTVEGLAACDRANLASDWADAARPGGSILALAGAVDAERVVADLNRLLSGWSGDAGAVSETAEPPRGLHHIEDDTNQVQIAVAHDGPKEPDAGAMLERVVTSALSGGMSGRLFTEVREKRGLCYSVSASYAADRDFGRTVAYVGTTPERAQEALDVLLAEMRRINTPEGAVTQGEFERAVVGMKSRLVMSGESTSARAGALARDVYKLGRARSLDEMAAEVDAVTLDAVNAYLAERSLGRMTVVTLGPSGLTCALG